MFQAGSCFRWRYCQILSLGTLREKLKSFSPIKEFKMTQSEQHIQEGEAFCTGTLFIRRKKTTCGLINLVFINSRFNSQSSFYTTVQLTLNSVCASMFGKLCSKQTHMPPSLTLEKRNIDFLLLLNTMQLIIITVYLLRFGNLCSKQHPPPSIYTQTWNLQQSFHSKKC